MRRSDMRYMSEYRAALARRPSVTANLLILTIIAFFLGAGYWASQAVLDEVAIGSGQVIPSGQVQVVQNLEGGILKSIDISEGDVIGEGDVLLVLDDTQFSSQMQEVGTEYRGLAAKIARLQTEASGGKAEKLATDKTLDPDFRDYELALFQARQAEFAASRAVLRRQLQQRHLELAEKQEEISNLSQSLKLAEEEMSITRPMVERNVAPRVDLVRLQRKISELEGQLRNTRKSQPRIRAAISEADNRIAEKENIWKAEVIRELNEARIRLRTLEETLKSLKDRVHRTEVRAPVNGTIKRVLVTTVGGVVQPGMPLAEIVPADDTLLVEARIQPADVAFLHPGQKATVKLTAYDFSIYGGLDATLEYISADTIQDPEGGSFYQIHVRTGQNYLDAAGRKLSIIPGMVAEVNIITGSRSVLDYLLKPILKVREKALRER